MTDAKRIQSLLAQRANLREQLDAVTDLLMAERARDEQAAAAALDRAHRAILRGRQ